MAGVITKLLVCGLMSWTCGAQEAKSGPAFEVASVKQAGPRPPLFLASGKYIFRAEASRFEATSESFLGLISFAYNVDPARITGPGWLQQEYYAVIAKPPAGATKAEIPAMLQTLLTERFHLSLHHDPKELPVYELVITRQDPKLARHTDGSEDGCSSYPGEIFCRAVTMEQLANFVSRPLGINARMRNDQEFDERRIDRAVIDKTGLAELYDLDAQWVPASGLPIRSAEWKAKLPPRDPKVKADSIFSALETLGLRLQPGKHVFDQLVIDHVDKVPTEN